MKSQMLTLIRFAAIGCEAKTSNPPAYSTVSGVVDNSCAACHTSAGMTALLTAVAALPADGFDDVTFPASDFQARLRPFTTDDLAEEPYISSGMPNTQAWVLHELNRLDALLAEDVPPDFTDEESLNAFTLYSGGGYTEGCELLEKVELGRGDSPDGMPPPWAANLMALLGDDFVSPTVDEREDLLVYTEGVLGPDFECPPE